MMQLYSPLISKYPFLITNKGWTTAHTRRSENAKAIMIMLERRFIEGSLDFQYVIITKMLERVPNTARILLIIAKKILDKRCSFSAGKSRNVAIFR